MSTDTEHTTSRTDTEPQWADLTGFQRDILAVLQLLENEEETPYGLEIKRRLEQTYGEVNHGRLYPNLDDLVADGLVEKGELDARTNSYEVTDAGRDLLEAQARELRTLTCIGGEQP